MSNKKSGRATKGSQKWVQNLVNLHPDIINKILIGRLHLPIDAQINWVSPLGADNFKEYRDNDFLKHLRIDPAGLKRKLVNNFWPKQGASWDALAFTNSGQVILVEAKSHIGEILTEPTGAKKLSSISTIQKSLEDTKSFLEVNSPADWSNCFYQYANRLAHLYFLRNLNEVKAHLVFLYFLNDKEQCGPKNAKEWNQAIRRVERALGLPKRHKLSNSIHKVFIDVRKLG